MFLKDYQFIPPLMNYNMKIYENRFESVLNLFLLLRRNNLESSLEKWWKKDIQILLKFLNIISTALPFKNS